MALKPLQDYGREGVEVTAFMTPTGDRGRVVIYTGTGSGQNLDDSTTKVAFPTGQAVSGTYAAGILLCDVVNKTLTEQMLNPYKAEVQAGGKVAVLRKGRVCSNMLADGITIVAGQKAYYDTTGYLTNVDSSGTVIGQWVSKADANGYATLDVNLPN